MIEIDDAGGGCFVGPEVLVIHHLENDHAWFYFIPPEVHDRVKYGTKVLKRAFVELQIPKTETIKLCRGEIFDPIQVHLTEQGYHVVREKVSSSTDCLAEAKFMEILHSYGFPSHLTLENRNYHEFYQLVGFWFFSQPKQRVGKLRKIRLQPPAVRYNRVIQNYPNLIRLMLECDAGRKTATSY